MVSPLEKNGIDISGGFGKGAVQAAVQGGAVTYATDAEFSEPKNGNGGQYLARRISGGWATQNIALPIAATEGAFNENGYYAFSADLSSAILEQTGPTLVSTAPTGYHDLYLRNDTSAAYKPLIVEPPRNRPPNVDQISYFHIGFADATPDFSHIVFPANDALIPNAPDPGKNHFNLYEWVSGQLRMVNILPGGSTDPNAGLGDGTSPAGSPLATSNVRHAISDNGSRIYWTDLNNENLYLRVNGESTVQVDASQRGPESGGGHFWGASSDGSKVFFTDTRALTGDAAVGTHQLYEYNASNGQLTDLTVDNTGSADVQGVLGTSEDGSYVYFVANGVLAPSASPGTCSGASGTCSLYLWHDNGTPHGTISFIATLAGDDDADWGVYSAPQEFAAVTPDGRHLAFMSNAHLAGYDNGDANAGTPDAEVYLYDAESARLTCASCNPSGARPVGGPVPLGISGSAYPSAGNLISGQLPEWSTQTYQPHYLSADGSRLFFESYDALAPQDTNGKLDVYEWEADGAGSCRRSGGCIYLISSGTSSDNSFFADASSNGEDVFFFTRSQLVAQDTDNLIDLYDAHVDGGFPAQIPTSACQGEACKSPPVSLPASLSLLTLASGLSGNLMSPSARATGKPKPKKAAGTHGRGKKVKRKKTRKARRVGRAERRGK